MSVFGSWYAARCLKDAPAPPSPRSSAISALGDKIRALKAQKAPDTAWRPLVAEMNALKSELPPDHPLSQATFAAAKQQQATQKKDQEAHSRKELASRLAAKASEIVFPITQRKLPHAISTQGEGDDYKYVGPVLNPKADGMHHGAEVWVTEKWDGTTVQATRNGIFKRLDKFARGSKAKRNTPVADRYELRLVAWCEGPGAWVGLQSDERIQECVQPYLHKFEQIPEDMCIFFEAVHTKINTTFKQVQNFADIRVFDVASCSVPSTQIHPGEQWPASSTFLDFEETVSLCDQLELPIVHHHRAKLSGEAAWSWLNEVLSEGKGYVDVAAAPLEGFVLREVGCGGHAAKLRVEYLSTRNEKRALQP